MSLIPESDEKYLKQKKFQYEIKQEGAEIHIILKNWEFPEAYTPRNVDILIRLMPNYPFSPVDMFWTSPDVKLSNGGGYPQAADYHETHGGKGWQRWSRHNEWRVGVDNLRTFITAMSEEIKRGI